MSFPKKKIAYISVDYFADVDLPLLPYLGKEFDLTWFLFISNFNRYNLEELKLYAHNNNFKIELFLIGERSLTFKNLKKFLSFGYKLYKVKFDLYYFEFYMALFMYGIIQFISKKKKILALHDVKPHSNHYKKRQHIFQNLLINSFSYFHTFSSQQHIILKEHYAKESFFIPLAKKNSGTSKVIRPSTNEYLRLLFFGGIHSYKRLDLVIKALEKVVQVSEKKLLLTIAGDGPDWENCKSFISNKSLFDIKIGFVPQNEIPDLFMSHHYLVLPYQDVTQSGPLFDAMNYNLPVIASDEKGFAEFITDGKNGFLFKSQSLESLINRINEVSKMKETQYEEILQNLKSHSDSFSAVKISNLYSKMFFDLCESNNGGI
ncbi:glycosyltransferase family 4 protein [Flavobacterium sp. ASV13]|uniref:glycosyltransferase family 4 protein n=1 Tax=Flavobacterium sp. ASV13 TaxID=1506583 RepID=UPI000555EFAD|nr:glycosyltransferase [Flavobacterium sp. ASV13]